MTIEPIARFRSPFATKFGIPRQAGLAKDLRGQIVFDPAYSNPEALRGLEGFDFIWLIWGFSGNMPKPQATCHTATGSAGTAAGSGDRDAVTDSASGASYAAFQSGKPEKTACASDVFRPTVRPPRLGGNTRIGVFASRSPFRPNSLGLSSVRIESIGPGPVINVLGADLMDGTPIYDIKPYVPYADSHPDARGGFTDTEEWENLEVVVPEELKKTLVQRLGQDQIRALTEVLSQDPRPQYHNDPERIYGMNFAGLKISFRVSSTILTVTGAVEIPDSENNTLSLTLQG